MGAVSTTTIAGVLAIRKGIAKPIGSLTQMGTIRLGKRTEGRSPRIDEGVPLTPLDDLVFGARGNFPRRSRRGRGGPGAARSGAPGARADQAVAGGFRQALRQAARRPERGEGQEQEG